MEAADFRRILTTFADSPAAIEMDRGRLLVQIREELIEADIAQRARGLEVTESGSLPVAADRWIIDRIARVPQLADRLLTNISATPNFVAPKGEVIEDMERSVSELPTPDVADCVERTISILDRRPAGTSTVLYLTSDAGEGKTTVINEIARHQAQAYKAKESDWLLIPISLGGRPFMRFDDVVIGALVNRFRFPFFYYDAFLELVRLGVVVPAFDGFEEMFVESASGEALSALGSLVTALDSSGTLLVSARKAYFEFKDFRSQAKLFDAIKSKSVTFSQVALQRWTRHQFIDYSRKRSIAQPEAIYSTVAERLGPDHPILTRAVLVKRLLDVSSSIPGTEALAVKLKGAAHDYFYDFVNAIIEREAAEKWIDRSGSPAKPLLTVEEHHDLLAVLAGEMWIGGTEALRIDVVDLLSEIFAETHGKSPETTRQIKERLKQHALITTDSSHLLVFDHEDFRRFFLGQAIAAAILEGNDADIRTLLQKGALPSDVADNTAQVVRRSGTHSAAAVEVLSRVAATDYATSFTRENCGAILIRLVDGGSERVEIKDLPLPVDSLRERKLRNVRFTRCFFEATSLEGTTLENCHFVQCVFSEIESTGDGAIIRSSALEGCEVRTVHIVENDTRVFEPTSIVNTLRRLGFTFPDVAETKATDEIELDSRTVLVERAMRVFLRKTQPNEDLLRLKLGVRANEFFDRVLPGLLKAKVFEEVAYLGSGKQRRFKLAMPMERIERAIRDGRGDFDQFLTRLS